MMQLHLPTPLLRIERDKNEEIWGVDEYENVSPGLENIWRFMEIANPARKLWKTSLIDLGCGTGVAGLEFARLGLDVHYLDITGGQLKPEVPKDRFIEQPLWQRIRKPSPQHWEWGFCVDVMEHLPPELAFVSVLRMLEACKRVWLQIAFQYDKFGEVIGQELHLTVAPYTWWLERLGYICKVNEARDLCGRGLFIVEA